MVLAGDVGHVGLTTGLEQVRLAARALPERDLAEVDLTTRAFGAELAAPLLVSCMTGGTTTAGSVNRALAAAAQEVGVAVGLGSGRVLLEGGDPTSFDVRRLAPDVPLLANLGAVQLPEVGVEGCRRLLDLTGADVLVLHLNPVQEAVQPEGDTGFAGLAERIGEVVAALEVPVVVKEVGFGLAAEDLALLLQARVAGIDVAGAGGTNWARVEGQRDTRAGLVAAAFGDWGWPTADVLRAAATMITALPVEDRPTLIASGGLADGVDVVKSLCLGADLAAFGRRLVAPAAEGAADVALHLEVLIDQVRIATWAVGAPATTALDHTHLVPSP